MEKREREQILGEWGVRDDTLRGRRQRAALQEDMVDNPLRGRPIRDRQRNWRPEADSYIASLGGPLPYMQRLRAIHDETEEHLARLAAAYEQLAREHHGHEFAVRWRRLLEGWRFDAVNELIDRHNRWFPIEARLPMDPRTGDFALVGGEPYWKRPLDAVWALQRFPAEPGRAAA